MLFRIMSPKLPSDVAQCWKCAPAIDRLDWLYTGAGGRMLAGWPHCCNCAISRKYSCFCTTLRKTARCLQHHCIPPASLQLRTGPTRATWSLGHANCEDSRSAIWKTWVEEEGCKLWGGGLEGARRTRSLPNRGEKCRTICVCISFVALLSSCLVS